MAEVAVAESPDRIILRLDPGAPIELNDLTHSFAALARIYERHYRKDGEQAPKLYVVKLDSGSVVAEIVPLVTLLGAIIYTMDSGVIVADFTRRLVNGIKAFSEPKSSEPALPAPSKDDASDIREFVRPLTGKHGAELGIKHARYEAQDGERHTVVEYTFDEAALNRAAVNIDSALTSDAFDLLPFAETGERASSILSEVMLFFETASRKPGKEQGRTADRGIVPDVSDKALPVHFRSTIHGDLKAQMVRGDVNPLTNFAFVVDVHVQRVDGEPKAYLVTDLHRVIPLDDGPPGGRG